MLFSSFSTRSMVFAYFAKAQLPFSLFRDLFNDTAEFTLCYGLHDCSPLFQGYFIHSLSTLYYYNAPSLATRLTGDYRDRTYTGKCSPALQDTRKNKGQKRLFFAPFFARFSLKNHNILWYNRLISYYHHNTSSESLSPHVSVSAGEHISPTTLPSDEHIFSVTFSFNRFALFCSIYDTFSPF